MKPTKRKLDAIWQNLLRKTRLKKGSYVIDDEGKQSKALKGEAAVSRAYSLNCNQFNEFIYMETEAGYTAYKGGSSATVCFLRNLITILVYDVISWFQ
jgi:hypothetical protein